MAHVALLRCHGACSGCVVRLVRCGVHLNAAPRPPLPLVSTKRCISRSRCAWLEYKFREVPNELALRCTLQEQGAARSTHRLLVGHTGLSAQLGASCRQWAPRMGGPEQYRVREKVRRQRQLVIGLDLNEGLAVTAM